MKKNKLILGLIIMMMALMFTQCKPKSNDDGGNQSVEAVDSAKALTQAISFYYKFKVDALPKGCRSFVSINGGARIELFPAGSAAPAGCTDGINYVPFTIDCSAIPKTVGFVISLDRASGTKLETIHYDDITDCSGTSFVNTGTGACTRVVRNIDMFRIQITGTTSTNVDEVITWPPTVHTVADSLSTTKSGTTK